MANSKLKKSKLVVTAIHKSGSMFLFKYFNKIAEMNNLPYFSGNNNPKNADDYKTATKGILCPLRKMRELQDGEILISQIRNPLDILVSRYFSFGYMHNLANPEKGTGSWPGIKDRSKIQNFTIDQYCIEESELVLERLNLVKSYQENPNALVVSYFTMVHDYKTWNQNICQWLGLSQRQEDILHKEFKNEFKVSELEPSLIVKGIKKRHKRKIYPGDSNYKLKPITIKELNQKFSYLSKLNDELKSKTALINHVNHLSNDINKLTFKPTSYLKNPEKAFGRITRFEKKESKLIIEGWTFLKPKMSKATRVLLLYNNKRTVTNYNHKSLFIGKKFDSPKLNRCKWRTEINVADLKNGVNKFRFRSEDRETNTYQLSRIYNYSHQ